MLDLFRQRLTGGSATNGYPDVVEPTPPTFRGMPRLLTDRCEGAAVCARVCPAGSIVVTPKSAGRWSWTLDRASFLGCGLCIEACPHGALEPENVFEVAGRTREDLKVTAELVEDGSTGSRETVEALGGKLRERIQTIFGRSLQLRHLDVGSCNGCDWELNALLNPVYDLQRFGIATLSPRPATPMDCS